MSVLQGHGDSLDVTPGAVDALIWTRCRVDAVGGGQRLVAGLADGHWESGEGRDCSPVGKGFQAMGRMC